MTPRDAVEYTPHSFRHVLIVAGQQLRSSGVVRSEDIESLGHWQPGSAMPRAYDSEAGVSELQTRVAIMDAVRTGWRPVREGELPIRISQDREKRQSVATGVRGCRKAARLTVVHRREDMCQMPVGERNASSSTCRQESVVVERNDRISLHPATVLVWSCCTSTA